MNVKTANPNFFIVKINKEEQKQKKQGTGLIKNADTFIFGKGGMQSGEVVAIGKLAHLVMPFAKIGGTLIFSWKVEFNGENNEKPNMALVDEDEENRYYTVTISEFKGRSSETYAYYDDTNICFTHPSFVVVKKEVKEPEMTETKSGILLFQSYRPSDTEITHRIAFNTQHIYSLSITHAAQAQLRESDARQTKELIQSIELQNRQLTGMLQGKERFEPYSVAYCNPLHDCENGDTVFGENIFFLEPIEIKGEKLFIGKYNHLGMHISNKQEWKFRVPQADTYGRPI